MSRPTLQEVLNLLGTILNVNGEAIGLVVNVQHNKHYRSDFARVRINHTIKDTHKHYAIPIPHTTADFMSGSCQIYESSRIDKQWISVIWPPQFIGTDYLWDVQIQEEKRSNTPTVGILEGEGGKIATD